MKKHTHENKTKGMLYAVYIKHNDKWQKIGELCAICGFHINKELLKEIGIADNALSFSFNGLVSKKQ